MLECKDVVKYADALIADELTFRQKLAVRFHLFMCRHCSRYVAQLRLLVRSIPFMHGAASEDEVEKILNRVRCQHHDHGEGAAPH